jgi:hypothetical protein
MHAGGKGSNDDSPDDICNYFHMQKPSTPEEINARLNREIWRTRFGGWKPAVTTLVLLGFILAFVAKIPTGTQFVLGEVTGYHAVATESGTRQHVIVLWTDTPRMAGVRSHIALPVKGDTVCLRQSTYWPFGNQAMSVTDMRFCDGTNATSAVD